ncbi:uncharacterized protein B0P05DRAFT_592077 [Gilbertella persicaria]|uniref:uncharacterized protein n=1 Tax=Gilbertella persicaria TaxID=101096 RepID=UPI002220E265|nr:uncharacterized protein B0P05DRAFT_592077 [Gilbertella persicaria]KAI8049800.1 hypothetical protein B0P05DRAFT_592077 [Gilbertella persicaria]
MCYPAYSGYSQQPSEEHAYPYSPSTRTTHLPNFNYKHNETNEKSSSHFRPVYRDTSPMNSPIQYNNGFHSDMVYHNNTTLPPLNTSPQLNRPRERWIPDDRSNEKQPDPTVLAQYPPMQSREERKEGIHSDIGPYGCGVMGCFASFSASNGLFYHMKSAHPNLEEIYKPYRCAMPNCPKRYKNINGLQYHLREAKGSSGHGNVTAEDSNAKPYQCSVVGCKKAYRTANGLRYHQQNGHTVQPMPMMDANIMPMSSMINMPRQHYQQQQQQREKWQSNNHI